MVWDAGSRGQKSSEARTMAVCLELHQGNAEIVSGGRLQLVS